jgi:signal transduction histidine kinase
MPSNLKVSKRNYFYIIAGFSIITILSSILLALYTITDNHTSLSYLDKAYGINTRIDKIYSILKDEENRQRGYLITYSPSFFESTDYAAKNVHNEYTALYNVLKGEDEQQEHLITLKTEIDMKLKMLMAGKKYLMSGNIKRDSLIEIMGSNHFIMTKMRKTIGKMKRTEYKRFSSLRENAFAKSRFSIFIVSLTCGISIILLTSTLFALKREYDAKALIQKKLIASEKRLKEQVDALYISNKELEQFAYVASHDLEAPLRKISVFSEKINSKLKDYPDEEVIDWLKRLNTSAARMRVFINDLLNYSKITRSLDITETVNLNSILKLVTEDLELTLNSKKAIVKIQPLIETKGNNTQLRQLFQNLVSNALKFNDKPFPQITIYGEYYTKDELKHTTWLKDISIKHQKYYCIFVTDNGIGFKLEYLQQIFVIFQRLHGRSEFEGTGIGLAICKRIVESHEGFITAESEVGIGTKFIVGLPVTK